MGGESKESEQNGVAEPFFAPDRADVDPGGALRTFGLRRLLVRVAACIVALIVLDHAIAPLFAPPSAYLHAYRLPRVAPTAALADYANAIDLTARVPGHAPIAVFLGASPTYGHRIENAAHTFPYAYASAASSAGVAVTSFNVAANGMFVGDFYILAKRLIPSSDIVFVQLTYHTFSPAARGGKDVRYPELPQVLGVPLTSADAPLLGLNTAIDGASERPAPTAVDGVLNRWWTLWRERDIIDRRVFGGSPRDALAQLVSRMTRPATSTVAATTTILPDDSADDGFAAFDSLGPGEQMVVLARYAEESSFTIAATDPEVRILDRLASEIAAAHKKAVFFVGPLNESVIAAYGLIDAAQYRRNVALLRQTVTRHGFTLIDHNTDSLALPRADFADISHTTDAGGTAFGAILYRDTAAYLRQVAP